MDARYVYHCSDVTAPTSSQWIKLPPHVPTLTHTSFTSIFIFISIYTYFDKHKSILILIILIQKHRVILVFSLPIL